MKDINYDLVKLLHQTLDIVWQLENHYIKDAEEVKCHSVDALKKILEDEKKHAQMIAAEIKLRSEAKIFD